MAVAAAVTAPAGASAAIPFRACSPGDENLFDVEAGGARQCARVSAPLDPSGAAKGRIGIHVERVRASRRRSGALFALVGGPGQAAAPFTADFAASFAPALRSRDLIVLDQRGTGRSGALRCPSLERSNLVEPASTAALRCAERIGARRAFFTTRESVADIELIRRRLGVPRIALYAVSYGTKVALGYALRYPDRVERLVLDSTVEPEGPDPFYRPSLKAMPRVLRSLCEPSCRGVTSDPARDLETLVRSLRSRPLRGYVVDRDGRRRRAALDRTDVFVLLLAGDLDPGLRTAVPATVRAALRGDLAPILRLAAQARRTEGEPPPPRELSVGLYAVTTCEESPLPWSRSAPRAQRRPQAESAVSAISEEVLRPFDRATALASDILRLCERWPAGPEPPPPPPPGPLPAVRTLVLSGDQDLRTPREEALSVAARLPRARVVTVREAAHSVLSSDFTGCGTRAIREFFANRRVPARCGRRVGVFRADPAFPSSLREVRGAAGVQGRRGRTLTAVRLTVADVIAAALARPSGGGLRGGRYAIRVAGFDRLEASDLDGAESEQALEQLFEELLDQLSIDIGLEGVEFVSGVRVSGRVSLGLADARGRLEVSGRSAAGGVLRIGGDEETLLLSGRLDGRRVRSRGRLGPAPVRAAALSRAELSPGR